MPAKTHQCLINTEDLQEMMKNHQLVAYFNLTEKERKVVIWYVNGLNYEAVAGMEKVSISRVHALYTSAIRKIREGMIEKLNE